MLAAGLTGAVVFGLILVIKAAGLGAMAIALVGASLLDAL